MREEGVSKTEAFKRIAASTGRSAGTVSVTYYRVSGKTKGKGPAHRAARATGPRQAALARSASRALEDLARLIIDQERELLHLRKENATFREIRRILA